ncbi:MAG: 50S ribosomal protein L4 [Tissierellia bacterium]|nr:50S ribosomal protein L4 [Tissierellia bacterium]
MANIKVLNMEGKEVEELSLNDDFFDIEVNEHAVYLVVKNILANRRQGTQSAKTRAEVRGGGRKPWRQKGTGRARQGSIRSPQWRGGGVVFAPKPRSYRYTTPKKVRRLALKSVLTSKLRDGEIIVLDQLNIEAPKTKDMVKVLKAVGADEKALIVTKGADNNVALSVRNLPLSHSAMVETINVYDLLKYNSLVITKEAIQAIEEVYS